MRRAARCPRPEAAAPRAVNTTVKPADEAEHAPQQRRRGGARSPASISAADSPETIDT